METKYTLDPKGYREMLDKAYVMPQSTAAELSKKERAYDKAELLICSKEEWEEAQNVD